jgi:hypothetical protein
MPAVEAVDKNPSGRDDLECLLAHPFGRDGSRSSGFIESNVKISQETDERELIPSETSRKRYHPLSGNGRFFARLENNLQCLPRETFGTQRALSETRIDYEVRKVLRAL